MTLVFAASGTSVSLEPARVVIAGWTGRDREKVDHHIEELAAIGVAPPSRVPLAYEVSADRVTQAQTITCVGAATSGEAEPVVLFAGGERWLTLGSDHTDRALEAHSVALSKQICTKPVARHAWRWADVADRLDTLELASEIDEGSGWTAYQSGALAAIRPLEEVIAVSGLDGSVDAVLFCGTLGAIGGVRAAPRMRMTLKDPASGQTIALDYTTTVLPEVA